METFFTADHAPSPRVNVTEAKVTEPIPESFQEAGRRGIAAARRALQASNSAGNGEKVRKS